MAYTSFKYFNKDGNSATSLGTLFQCLTALSLKNFCSMSSPGFQWLNLRTFSPVLFWEKRLTVTTYSQIVVESDGGPLSLLFPRLNNPSSLPHSSPDPSPVSLPFFGHTPAFQCFSFSEGPRTAHSTLGVVSPLLSTGGQVMIPFLATWAPSVSCTAVCHPQVLFLFPAALLPACSAAGTFAGPGT